MNLSETQQVSHTMYPKKYISSLRYLQMLIYLKPRSYTATLLSIWNDMPAHLSYLSEVLFCPDQILWEISGSSAATCSTVYTSLSRPLLLSKQCWNWWKTLKLWVEQLQQYAEGHCGTLLILYSFISWPCVITNIVAEKNITCEHFNKLYSDWEHSSDGRVNFLCMQILNHVSRWHHLCLNLTQKIAKGSHLLQNRKVKKTYSQNSRFILALLILFIHFTGYDAVFHSLERQQDPSQDCNKPDNAEI